MSRHVLQCQFCSGYRLARNLIVCLRWLFRIYTYSENAGNRRCVVVPTERVFIQAIPSGFQPVPVAQEAA